MDQKTSKKTSDDKMKVNTNDINKCKDKKAKTTHNDIKVYKSKRKEKRNIKNDVKFASELLSSDLGTKLQSLCNNKNLTVKKINSKIEAPDPHNNSNAHKFEIEDNSEQIQGDIDGKYYMEAIFPDFEKLLETMNTLLLNNVNETTNNEVNENRHSNTINSNNNNSPKIHNVIDDTSKHLKEFEKVYLEVQGNDNSVKPLSLDGFDDILNEELFAAADILNDSTDIDNMFNDEYFNMDNTCNSTEHTDMTETNNEKTTKDSVKDNIDIILLSSDDSSSIVFIDDDDPITVDPSKKQENNAKAEILIERGIVTESNKYIQENNGLKEIEGSIETKGSAINILTKESKNSNGNQISETEDSVGKGNRRLVKVIRTDKFNNLGKAKSTAEQTKSAEKAKSPKKVNSAVEETKSTEKTENLEEVKNTEKKVKNAEKAKSLEEMKTTEQTKSAEKAKNLEEVNSSVEETKNTEKEKVLEEVKNTAEKIKNAEKAKSLEEMKTTEQTKSAEKAKSLEEVNSAVEETRTTEKAKILEEVKNIAEKIEIAEKAKSLEEIKRTAEGTKPAEKARTLEEVKRSTARESTNTIDDIASNSVATNCIKFNELLETISIKSSQSEIDCGYNSSDFEFITEEEAKKVGFIINFEPERNYLTSQYRKKVKTNKQGVNRAAYSTHSKPNSNSHNKAETESRVESSEENYVVPQEGDVVNMFHDMPVLPPSQIYFLENKCMHTRLPMLVQYEGVGFDVNALMQDDSDDDHTSTTHTHTPSHTNTLKYPHTSHIL